MRTVVVVEAVSDLADSYKSWLEGGRYHVIQCPGPDPIDYCCAISHTGRCPLAEQADLLIYDGWLPTGPDSCDGSSLIAEVRAAYPDKPMIVLARGANLEDNLIGFEEVYAGMPVLYPIDWRTLPTAVEQLIGPATLAGLWLAREE